MVSGDLVLVTGGSGYLAGWVVAALVERGFRVRVTMRNPARGATLGAKLGQVPFETAAADLGDDAGWADAMSGVRYVIHTATPMRAKGAALLAASREGTLRVLRAAADARVQRVVVTSSGYAALPASDSQVTRIDETVWTAPEAPGVVEYAAAKTLAERDAWAFAAAHPDMELVTILPGFILGPLQSAEMAPSVAILDAMLAGKLPFVPNIGMSSVDVRDVADLHIRAMLAPEAAGQRFIGSARFAWFRELAAILRRELGPDARKVSTRPMPDLVARGLALVAPPLRDLLPNLGRERHLDHAKATGLLGWTPRPLETTIADAGRSLIGRRA